MYYLLKTEPSEYSFSDLQKDKTTVWDGVTAPAAVKNLREMPKGSKLVIYHTGDERKVVGTANVTDVDASDPKQPRITIKVGKALPKGPALEAIKSKKLFADSSLLKIGRLSVVPLSEAQYRFLTGE